MSERILCAAIWFVDMQNNFPILNPKGCESGLVLCGLRHNNIVWQANAITCLPLSKLGTYRQGFLTTLNRFVDRKEGAEIFIANGGKPMNMNRLDSSDLY